MLTRKIAVTRISKLAATGACVLGLGLGATAHAQSDGANNPINDRLSPGNATERGVGEAIRSGVQGNSIGQSIQRGLGEAAQSAVETPQQTFQRDQWQNQQQFGNQPYQNGRPYYYDNQGRQVFTQPQGYNQQFSQGQYYPPQGQYQQYPQGQYYQGQPYSQGQYYQGQQYPQGQYYPAPQGQYYSGPQGQYSQGQPSPQGYSQGSQQGQSGPSLGVMIENSDQGVKVVGVQPQGAGEKAGLQTGDVIRSINGEEVQNPQSVAQRIRSADPNSALELLVIRNGEEQKLTATLEADNDYQAARPNADSGSSQQMQQQLDRLRRENEQLKRELEQLRQSNSGEAGQSRDANNQDAGNRDAARADAAAGQGAAAATRGSDANADAQGRANARAGAEAGNRGADAALGAGAEADAGADAAGVGAEAGIGADADAGTDSGSGSGAAGSGSGSGSNSGSGAGSASGGAGAGGAAGASGGGQ